MIPASRPTLDLREMSLKQSLTTSAACLSLFSHSSTMSCLSTSWVCTYMVLLILGIIIGLEKLCAICKI